MHHKNVRRRWFLILAAIVAAHLAVTPVYAQRLRPHEPLDPAKAQTLPTSMLTIVGDGKTHTFTVELADSPDERNIGLMHRNVLAPDHGMLFNFFMEQREQFWMRNTFIPLDMLFVHADGRIEFIAENTRPHDETPVGPRAPIMAVLELAGGTAKRLGIERGDVVHHEIFKNAK